jgi:hypothetical protein
MKSMYSKAINNFRWCWFIHNNDNDKSLVSYHLLIWTAASLKLFSAVYNYYSIIIQNKLRKELETKMKQMETKINYQELLIFTLKSQRITAETKFNSQFKIPGNSFSRESSDFRTCHGLRSVDHFLTSGMYWIDPDGKGVGEDPIYVFCNMTSGISVMY